jgi:hypothetical protein
MHTDGETSYLYIHKILANLNIFLIFPLRSTVHLHSFYRELVSDPCVIVLSSKCTYKSLSSILQDPRVFFHVDHTKTSAEFHML